MSRRKGSGRKRSLVVTMLALTGLLVLNVLPLLWGVLTSFKQGADILTYPPVVTFTPTLAHYARVLQEGFGRNLLVSLLDTLAAVALTMAVAVPAAYAFDRTRFRFRRPLEGFRAEPTAVAEGTGKAVKIKIARPGTKLRL